MEGKADAMVGHAVLREVVSANLLAAVAAADLGLAFFGQRLLLPVHFLLIETGTQHAHTFFAVLDLRFFVLAAYDSICWQMCDANSRISRVYRLTAGTRRAKRIDAQVFGFNLDVNVFSFRQ